MENEIELNGENELSKEDEREDERVTEFMTSGCECNFNKGKRCSTLFEESHDREIRNSCAELDHDSLDLVIKAQIMAHINTLNKGEGRHYNATFYHLSMKVQQ